MLPWVLLGLKGAAIGVGAYVGNRAVKKGEEMIEDAGGLGAAGDTAQEVLSRLDIFDLFGTRAAKEQEEQAAAEAVRRRDKAEARKREKELRKEQRRELDRLRKSQRSQLTALSQRDAASTERLEQQLKELEERHKRELQAAVSQTERRLAMARIQNVRALRAAQSTAQQPSATAQLKELVDLAVQLVNRDGVAPEAAMFVKEGVDPPDLSDLSTMLDGASDHSTPDPNMWSW